MNLVKAQPFLGRHARFAGQLIMMIDLPQSFQDVTAFGGKVWRDFYEAASAVSETVAQDDLQRLGQVAR